MTSTKVTGIHVHSRGIGMDVTNGCICCNLPRKPDGKALLVHNISFFVESKQDGEEVVSFFGGQGARLDYRDFEPNWIQAKVGACDAHKPILEALERAIRENDNVINASIVKTILSLRKQLEIPAITTFDRQEVEFVMDFLQHYADEDKKKNDKREKTDPDFASYYKFFDDRYAAVQKFISSAKYAHTLTFDAADVGKKQS